MLCPPVMMAPRLVHLVVAAPQQVVDGLLRHGFGDAEKIQRQFRFAPHGVDITEGVGGGDLAEEVGVVGDGREKVHRLHQGQLVGYFIYRGVVGGIEPHQQVGVVAGADIPQQLGQHAGAHLGAAAGAVGELGQFDVGFL